MRRISVAFWYKDIPIELSGKHIDYIIQNSSKFNLTIYEIKNIYIKYNEKFWIEGEAREEIIKLVARIGWIRIRHYIKPDYWSIQIDNYKKRKNKIKKFCDWAIDNNYMSFNDDIKILSYDTGEYINYGYKEGGVSSLYEAWGKNKEKVKKIDIKKGITNI